MGIEIPESYASPNATYAFFKRDHPNAPQPEFPPGKGSEAGLPASHGGNDDHVLCILHYGPEEGLAPVIGYKAVDPKQKGSDGWDVMSTKALGRALKRAGYPGDMLDLKAVRAWERRKAEDAAILAGLPLPVDAAVKADPDKDLVAAAKSPEVAEADHDDVAVRADETPVAPVQQTVTQPELSVVPNVQEEAPAAPADDVDPEYRETIRTELNSLNEIEKDAFSAFMGEIGLVGKAKDWSQEQLEAVEAWLHSADPE